MSYGPQTAQSLVSSGANLIIKSGLGPQTIEAIVNTALKTGAHITISSTQVGPQAAQKIAKAAGNQVTFIVEKK